MLRNRAACRGSRPDDAEPRAERQRPDPPIARATIAPSRDKRDRADGLSRLVAAAARATAISPVCAPTPSLPGRMHAPRAAAVDLYWIPLGAGGHCVRFNGRVFEAIQAARGHRQRCDLYHAALVVELDGDRYTLELAPSPDAEEASRGVVATGPVGSRLLGWSRLFRYEVRCCRGGSIPDLADAVGGPRTLTGEPRVARRLLHVVSTIPRPVWGRDELNAGEMWNSNSMIAWLIATAGLPTDPLGPPDRGRAPGWHAGLEVARRGGANVASHLETPHDGYPTPS